MALRARLLCVGLFVAAPSCGGVDQGAREQPRSDPSVSKPVALAKPAAGPPHDPLRDAVRDELRAAGEATRVVPAIWPRDLDALAIFESTDPGHGRIVHDRVAVEATRIVCYHADAALGLSVGFEWNSAALGDDANELVEVLGAPAETTRIFIHGFAAPGEAPSEQAARRLGERRAAALADRLASRGVARERLVLRGHGTELSAVLDPEHAPRRARAEVGDERPAATFELATASLPVQLSARIVERAGRVRRGAVHRGPHIGRSCWKLRDRDEEVCRSPIEADDDPEGDALNAEIIAYASRTCRRTP